VFDLTRSFEFDAGHRVLGHGGRCRHLHGHRYRVEITLSTSGLDSLGMVIDFADVKRIVGTWIDDNLDHNMLLNTEDPLHRVWNDVFLISDRDQGDLFAGKPPFSFTCENPTAENIAKLLFEKTSELLPDYTVRDVRVWETPACSVTYSGRKE
jgi:6-pyruvoyltetrahydropterin/6-carboxytetrahydropterin synthase